MIIRNCRLLRKKRKQHSHLYKVKAKLFKVNQKLLQMDKQLIKAQINKIIIFLIHIPNILNQKIKVSVIFKIQEFNQIASLMINIQIFNFLKRNWVTAFRKLVLKYINNTI